MDESEMKKENVIEVCCAWFAEYVYCVVTMVIHLLSWILTPNDKVTIRFVQISYNKYKPK